MEKLYEEAIGRVEDLVKRSPGVALGFHSVIDGLLKTDTEKMEKLLEGRNLDFQEPPRSIESLDDFLKGYMHAFSRGKAIQIMITKKEAFEEIMEIFGPGELRLGGTSANMAVALASFGFPDVLVYAYPLTRDLASLFPDFENLKTLSDDGRVVHPKKAWKGEGVKALHWIFEFEKGQKIFDVVCPRDNRFIASWNPVNSKLKVSESFRKRFPEMVSRYPKFLLAGFHIMRDEYPDGETVEERLDELSEFLKTLKDAGVSIHVELASIRFERVRKGVLEKILPVSDSVGMNEVELSWFASDMGLDPEGIQDGDPEKVLKALREMRKRTGLRRLHFHTLGYYMVVSDDVEGEKIPLAVSALAAAFRASTGRVPRYDELESARRFELSDFGLGVAEKMRGESDVFVLPTKIVPKPVLTVGLGDTISSIAFALS